MVASMACGYDYLKSKSDVVLVAVVHQTGLREILLASVKNTLGMTLLRTAPLPNACRW